MLEVHEQALQRVDEAMHIFLLRYREDERRVYGFVEGKDDPMFYRGIIERYLPDDWDVDLIRSGRKRKLIKTFESMDWSRFNKKRICFFLDRDLDEFLDSDPLPKSENIYITDGYSIENSIIEPKIFLRLLSECYNVVDLSNEEENGLIDHFSSNIEKFKRCLCPVMEAILFWRENKINAPLANLRLQDIFEYKDGAIELREQCADEDALVAVAAEAIGVGRCSEEDRAKFKVAFREKNAHVLFVRGKYLIWFISKFLEHVHSEIARFSTAHRSPPKPKASLGVGSFNLIAAPRARCPISLRQFIEKNYLEVAQSASS